MINIGDTAFTNIAIGDTSVLSVYVGDVQVYPSGFTPQPWFYVQDMTGNQQTIYIWSNNYFPSDPNSLAWSDNDGYTWNPLQFSFNPDFVASVTLYPFQRIHFKGRCEFMTKDEFSTVIFSTGDFSIGGNLASLRYGNSFRDQHVMDERSDYAFAGLFRHEQNIPYIMGNLIIADDLVVPQSSVIGTYASLFANQTALQGVPRLEFEPSQNAYDRMFYGCSSVNKIYAMFRDNGIGYTEQWTDGVSGWGDFITIDPNMWGYGIDGIPQGWNVIQA